MSSLDDEKRPLWTKYDRLRKLAHELRGIRSDIESRGGVTQRTAARIASEFKYSDDAFSMQMVELAKSVADTDDGHVPSSGVRVRHRVAVV